MVIKKYNTSIRVTKEARKSIKWRDWAFGYYESIALSIIKNIGRWF